MNLAVVTEPRPPLPPLRIKFSKGDLSDGPLLASLRGDAYNDDMSTWTRTRWGIWQSGKAPVRSIAGGTCDDAIAAAREIVRADRLANRDKGWFRTVQHYVGGLGVVQTATGWDLLRLDCAIDPYQKPNGGFGYIDVDPQNSLMFGLRDKTPREIRRERTDVQALVGETATIDLRATSPSGPTEPV